MKRAFPIYNGFVLLAIIKKFRLFMPPTVIHNEDLACYSWHLEGKVRVMRNKVRHLLKTIDTEDWDCDVDYDRDRNRNWDLSQAHCVLLEFPIALHLGVTVKAGEEEKMEEGNCSNNLNDWPDIEPDLQQWRRVFSFQCHAQDNAYILDAKQQANNKDLLS